MIGRTLAHYKILEKLGSGGMGEVYLAEDTKLDRKVALKVLPPELAESEERRARFTREAKAIAALNHPNIVTVHSVEEAKGIHFITMELVQGKTVSELIPKHGFSLNKFFEIAMPLVDAVASAHQHGITHRDLKPDNLMVNEEGRPKVLDFGLAKLRLEPGDAAVSELPTQAATQEGRIVGTVHYMSPEQAEGKPVDPRSDIFALGIIFYEMVTGERPFRGDSATAVLSSILKDTPASVTELKPDIPRDLAKLIRRSLAKDPIRRYQTAVDLRNDLEELKQEVDSGEALVAAVPSAARRARLTPSLWIAGTALAVFAIAWITGLFPTADNEPTVLQLANPVQVTSSLGVEDYPTWSPDGRTLAYAAVRQDDRTSGNWDIWVTQMGTAQAVNRTKDHTGTDSFPSWSPDGSQIAFWSDREGGGYFVMSALGGAPRKLISTPRRDINLATPQWSTDGDELAVVVGGSSGAYGEIFSLRTRESRRIVLPGTRNFRSDLAWSPNGLLFAYVDGVFGQDVTQLRVLRVSDGEDFAVTNGLTRVWGPTWSLNGNTLFFVSNREGSSDLWAQTVEHDGKLEGDPRRITVGLGMRYAMFSPDGNKLAYSKGRPVANLWRIPIHEDRPATWADAEQLTFDQAYIEYFDVSPDGDRVMVSSDRAGNIDLWMLPANGGEMVQVTHEPTPEWFPRWSPDGNEVAYYSFQTGNREIWVLPVNGGPARQLTDGKATGTQSYFPAWSPDGRDIAFAADLTNIYVVPSEGGEARLLTGLDDGNLPSWSPDGESIVFVRSGGGLWRAPSIGGDPELVAESVLFARWSRDGKRIFYIGDAEGTRSLWALSLDDRSSRQMTDLVGKPGMMGDQGLATDGEHLCFRWEEQIGDIWVMDVVTSETE